jgi:hypothetical protein
MMTPVSFSVLTASRQSPSVMGEVCLKIKIAGFSWPLRTFVLPDLFVPLILSPDFFVKTGLILDIAGSCFHFSFFPRDQNTFSISVIS